MPVMFSSTIIPTINRPTLSRTVRSVLDQDFTAGDFEVIVVNDSGQTLPEEDWQYSERVRIINTNRRERSVARNTGAAIAKGKYLHFLDDDDILLPGALKALWALDKQNEAIWLYGSYRTTDNTDAMIEEIHPHTSGRIFSLLVSGESIPLQASLINANHFFSAGCFDSNPTVVGVEDRDLGRRLAISGPVAYSFVIVAQIRIGEQGSTTNWAVIAEGDRWGREKALNLMGSYKFMRESIDMCLLDGRQHRSYLCGRALRAYFASLVWNLQHKNLLIAASRVLAALGLVGFHFLRPDFWQGLRSMALADTPMNNG